MDQVGVSTHGGARMTPVVEELMMMTSHIPDEFYCSITQEIMRDPVVAEDGYTYGKSVNE